MLVVEETSQSVPSDEGMFERSPLYTSQMIYSNESKKDY